MKRRWMIVGMIGGLLAACGVNPAERNNAANWYTTQGDYAAAVQAYQAAQVAAPDNALFYFNSAQALAQTGAVDAAAAALEQAIQRGDEEMQAMAFFNLGNLFFEQQQYQAAVEAYRQSLLLRPAWVDTRYNLELALLFIERPTPTALEQQTEPEDAQADASATPTPITAGFEPPTPTPPPEAPPSDGSPVAGQTGEQFGGQNATPQPRPGADMESEEARRILEEIESEQPGIGGGMPDYDLPPVTPASGKDW